MEARKNPKKPQELREALQQSKERFQGLFDLSSEWYWEQDRSCRFTVLTGGNLNSVGMDPEKYLGAFRWDHGAVPVGDDGSWDKHKATLEARQAFTDFVFKRVNSRGELRYIGTSGQPTFDGKKRFTGYRGFARDITQRVQMDLRLAIEHGVTRVLEESNSISEAAPQIIRVICETLDWACGSRWEPDEGGEAIRCAETWGAASADIEAFLEVTRRQAPSTQRGGLNRRAWTEGRPLWIRDVTKEKTFRRAPDAVKAGLRSAFAFPIKVGAQVISVMEFFSREIHQPDAELLDCTTYVGSQIGQFFQRKRAEEEQLRFRAAIDASADMITLVDRRTMHYVDVNAAACEMHGYTREQLLQMGPADFSTLSKEQLERSYDETIASGTTTRIESYQLRKDGTSVPTEVLRRAVRSGGQWIIVAVVRDISERKRDEQLRELEHAVNSSLAGAETVSEALKSAIRAICESLGWECGRCYLVDERADMLRFEEAWGVPEPAIQRFIEQAREFVYRSGDGLMGKAWQSGRPMWVADVTKDARARPVGPGIHSGFFFPIVAEGKTIGMLAFNSRQVREPEERLLQAVRVIGSQTGQYLRRKQAEEDLRRFRVAMNNSADMIVLIDRATMRFVDVNETSCRLLGYSREELLKMGPHDVLPTSREELERAYDEFIANPSLITGMQSRYRRKDGSTFPFESTRQILPSGNSHIIAAISRDISARVAAEEGLLRFRAALDTSADMIMLVDRATMRYVDVNATACEMQGYTRDEMLQLGPQDVSPVSKEALELSYDEMIASGKTTRLQSYHHHKNGTRIPVEILRRAVRAGERWIIVATVRDISERVAAEEALRESEARYQETFELAAIGIAHVDAGGRFISANRWLCELLGYTKEELLGLTIKQVSHPDDRNATDEVRAQLRDARINSFQTEKRYLRKDGALVWVGLTVALKRGSSGEPLYDISVVEDISARKQAEEALRQSEARFRSLTQLSSDMYWEQDDQFRFTSVSGTGSERVNRLTVQTIIGKKRWEQNYANMSADQWAEHIALLEAHKPFRDMELCRLDESGKKVWISISGEPVVDSSGALKGYRGVGKDITERKADEARIQYLAHHDGLTNLPNRVMFSELLNHTIHSAQRHRRNFAVLFIDLDRFKIINDSLGHEAGDALLKEMSLRLKGCLRASDLIARLGGDEFVVLIEEVVDPNQAATVARKILSAAIKPIVISGQECRVTASIGICLYPADAEDEQSLMKNADMAMYHAKEEGKNNYQFYSRDIKAQSLERLTLETNLRRALERDEFSLHYQAKVNLKTGAITGVEALLRWQNVELGTMSPLQFIPLAEETGLIVPIGKWVLRTACAQNVAWQRDGLPPVCMAVNLSVRQFASEELVADIAAALADSGMSPELLELEITEGMVIHNPERAIRLLTAIKKLGVRLAIDDFGTGYSSLGQLKHFPIDTLKVDRSFIREIPRDAEDKAITEAIIAMGKTLGLTIVAEGVETKEQQTFLREHFCDEMQGFYFSKPVASGDFAELLRRHGNPSKP